MSPTSSLFALLFATALVADSFAALPSFIKKCGQTDPNINDCLVKNANDALPQLLNGNKELRIPKLDPIVIPHVEQTSSNIKFAIDDVKIDGCQTLKMTKATADFVKKVGTLEMLGKHFVIDGDYEISGRILILPITGKGPIHIEMDDVVFKFDFVFDFVQKDGKTHGKLLKSEIAWDAGKSSYKLDNLFNGDEALGREMNKFLNENTKEVNKELGASVIQAIKEIVDNIFVNLIDSTPLNEIFD